MGRLTCEVEEEGGGGFGEMAMAGRGMSHRRELVGGTRRRLLTRRVAREMHVVGID